MRSLTRRRRPHVRHRGVRGAVLAVLALATITACASIPDTGSVHEVSTDDGEQQSTVRYAPAGPSDGDVPQAIVRGFLDAMLAYPVTTGTAEKFLTPRAAHDWQPSASTTVYTAPAVGGSRTVPDADGMGDPGESVAVQVTRTGRLDQSGHLTPLSGPARLTLHLIRVRGQWRITDPPHGILVTHKYFDDYFRPLDLYFFDVSGTRLVADPVYLAVGDQLSTALLTSLARGPVGRIAASTRTYLPAAARLRTSVPVRPDGTADVPFDDDLGRLDHTAQQRLSAQVVWTLRQLPDVTAVRIIGDDKPVTIDGESLQSAASWDGYARSSSHEVVRAVRGDRLMEVRGTGLVPVPGDWGKDAHGVVAFAVSRGRIAGVRADGDSAVVGSLAGGRVTTVSGSGLLAPQWGDDGDVWLVDRPLARTRLRIVDGGARDVVALGALARRRVTSFALSPDLARYAVTIASGGHSTLWTGFVRRDSKDRVVALEPPRLLDGPARRITSARAVTWTSPTDLGFLAHDAGVGLQVHTARIDGSDVTGSAATTSALLPDLRYTQLVLSTGARPQSFVLDGEHRLWSLAPGGSWQRLDAKDITAIAGSTESGE